MSTRAKMYADYLTGEGYRPTIDSDGDVIFKREGRTYYVDVDEKDDQFFRIVFPNFWSIESDDELMRVMIAANHATRLTKVAKVYANLNNENTTASIEVFVEHPENFRPIFGRAMSALMASVSNFVEKMEEVSK